MKNRRAGLTVLELLVVIAIVAIALALLLGGFTVYQKYFGRIAGGLGAPRAMGTSSAANRRYFPRQPTDTSGLVPLAASMPQWKPDASLEEISKIWGGAGPREIERIDRQLADRDLPERSQLELMVQKSLPLNSEGTPKSRTRYWQRYGRRSSSTKRRQSRRCPRSFTSRE